MAAFKRKFKNGDVVEISSDVIPWVHGWGYCKIRTRNEYGTIVGYNHNGYYDVKLEKNVPKLKENKNVVQVHVRSLKLFNSFMVELL